MYCAHTHPKSVINIFVFYYEKKTNSLDIGFIYINVEIAYLHLIHKEKNEYNLLHIVPPPVPHSQHR